MKTKPGNWSTKIYFSPKFRRELRLSFLKLQESLKAGWNLSEAELAEQNLDRELVVNLAATCAKFLKLIQTAEDWSFGRKLRNKKLLIYQAKNSRRTLIESTFFKVSKNLNSVETWILKNGLPKKGKTTVAVRYKRALVKKQYTLVDQGSYYQKISSLETGYYRFKTTKLNCLLKCTCKGKKCRSYEVERV